MTTEAGVPNRSKRFVLPYEPDYTAHRNNERASRVAQLHLKAREQVLAPAIAPKLSDLNDQELEGELSAARRPIRRVR